LIAEYLRISYLKVLVMATVPTLLYYLSILLMIEGDATKAAAPALAPAPSTPAPSTPAPSSYFHFTSLIIVAVLMAYGFSPFRAVFWATVAAVGLSFLGRRDEWLMPKRLSEAIVAGGMDVLPVLATTAVAGVIVGVVTMTGLGLRAAGLIVGMAAGSLPLTVLFSAVAVWILGLAVPVTASYIISAVMVVPALTAVGVAPVAAHMFIFYYAVLSEVSPPTALAPFAAAAITGGKPFRTMMLTWKYTVPAFLVPFAFTLDPRGLGLLLQGNVTDAVVSSLTAAIGVAAVAMGLGGFGLRRDSRLARALAVTGGLLLFHPAPFADLAGLAASAAALAISRRPAAGVRS
jgi:TRAP-type uncharacterized transport system fused permease subunit